MCSVCGFTIPLSFKNPNVFYESYKIKITFLILSLACVEILNGSMLLLVGIFTNVNWSVQHHIF